MPSRRKFITGVATVSTVALAGCTGSDADESGRVRYPDDTLVNFDVQEGETIRVVVDNQDGYDTVVQIQDTNEDLAAEEFVETEAELTYTAESSGVHRVFISPDDLASYEVYIEE